MQEAKFSASFTLTLVSSFLIILNGAWIITQGSPILLSPFVAASVEEVMAADNFWGRIAFGDLGVAQDPWAALWLVLPAVMLICAVSIYRKPRKHSTYSPWIMIFALLSIPIGGGFYVGAILGFIGGVAGIEWPKPFKETFLGKMIGTSLLDSKLYYRIYNDPHTLRTAAFTVAFIAILAGIGNGLYTYNTYLIKQGGDTAFNILLKGQIVWEQTPVMTASALIGVTILRWLIISLTIYWIGAKLIGASSDYAKVAAVVAFALVPLSLQVFLPVMFSNEPTLSLNWPLGLYFISTLWVFIALVVSTAQMFDFTKAKALGTVIFGGIIYWMIDNLLIIPTLNVPGVRPELSSTASSQEILLMLSVATIIAIWLGAFTREKAV